MKKVSALFLAMLMCMALAVPALATGTTSGDSLTDANADGKVTYTAKVQEPTIDVTVPSTNRAIVLNPYKIEVGATAKSVASGDIATTLDSDTSDAPILASVLYLHNKSTVPLKMTLTLKGEASSTVAFSATSVSANTAEKNKKVFIFADVGATVSDEPEAALSDVTYTGSSKQGVFKNGELKMTEVTTIPVADTVATGNWTPISLGGDCTTSPSTPWGDADTVNISMVFSFQAADTTVS